MSQTNNENIKYVDSEGLKYFKERMDGQISGSLQDVKNTILTLIDTPIDGTIPESSIITALNTEV